ncbi:MAG: low affinity iron permease family protein [Bdellovibrionota bacterium]
MQHQNLFNRFTKWSSRATGHPGTFVLALATILVWAVTGPYFHYNDTWQLAINTGTTIVTFLMVFLIQSSQNRDTIAIQIKLDELIRSVKGAHNALLDLEELDEIELEKVRASYQELADSARKLLRCGTADTDCPPAEITGKARRSKPHTRKKA